MLSIYAFMQQNSMCMMSKKDQAFLDLVVKIPWSVFPAPLTLLPSAPTYL
jgi:hypothetical protein